MKNWVVLVGLAVVTVGGAARAHVVLAEREAPAGTYYKLVVRVPHGCDGAPTTALRIEIPPAINVAKPMAKPGWTIETTRGKLSPPVRNEGRMLTDRVASISWRGGSLADDQFDDFPILVRLPARPGSLSFPVVQTCGAVTVRWDEPASGHGAHSAAHPAPVLGVVAAEPSH